MIAKQASHNTDFIIACRATRAIATPNFMPLKSSLSELSKEVSNGPLKRQKIFDFFSTDHQFGGPIRPCSDCKLLIASDKKSIALIGEPL